MTEEGRKIFNEYYNNFVKEHDRSPNIEEAFFSGNKILVEQAKEIEEFKKTNHELAELAIARNKRIAELEQKLEQTEKDLADYQFNYPTIKELEKEKCELLGIIQKKDKAIKKLIADMAGLEEELEKMTSVANHQQDCNMKRYFKLKQAKEILKEAQGYIENIDDVLYDKIEQFLEEIEK